MEICTKKERKIKKGEDIVPVTFLSVPPEKNVGNYLESKLQNETIWHYPEWDSMHQEPGTELIFARRELLAANKQLDTKRNEYLKRRKVLDVEWKDLAYKEASLRRSFIMFHKFVKENQEKKERARRRIQEEILIHERRDEEINKIKMKIEKMSSVRASLENSVKKLKIYENYLSDVVSVSPEYKSIISILNRYDALSSARNDLVKRQKEDLEELERERINMMELIEERVGVIMGLNNKLAELQSRYEKAKTQTRYWETVVYKMKNKSSKQLLKIYMVQDSIWNLYQQMCTRKGTPIELKKNDVEEQLLYIKGTISEYKRIVKIAMKKSLKDISSMHTDSGRSESIS